VEVTDSGAGVEETVAFDVPPQAASETTAMVKAAGVPTQLLRSPHRPCRHVIATVAQCDSGWSGAPRCPLSYPWRTRSSSRPVWGIHHARQTGVFGGRTTARPHFGELWWSLTGRNGPSAWTMTCISDQECWCRRPGSGASQAENEGSIPFARSYCSRSRAPTLVAVPLAWRNHGALCLSKPD
jgi:hypothetical protein